MTAKDVYAYRASEELAAAIRARLDEIDRFRREVVKYYAAAVEKRDREKAAAS